MACTAAICDSFKQELLQGIHQAADVYMVALYGSSAALDKTTTAYTATGEISGTGYTAGGQALAGFTTGLSGDTAYIDWSTDPNWPSATLTGVVAALIYNSTRANRAVAVLTFSSASCTNAAFTAALPAAGTTAVITLA